MSWIRHPFAALRAFFELLDQWIDSRKQMKRSRLKPNVNVPLDQRARAERLLEKTFKGCRDRSDCAIEIAFIYTSLGENDQAFAWHEEAYQNRDGGLIPVSIILLPSTGMTADLERVWSKSVPKCGQIRS
jgi:hypothetical protein